MIKSIQFKNFKVLRDCTLPLSQFTLIIGPNGTGKSTALRGLLAFAQESKWSPDIVSASVRSSESPFVEIKAEWAGTSGTVGLSRSWTPGKDELLRNLEQVLREAPRTQNMHDELKIALKGARVYALDANVLSKPVLLESKMVLAENGAGLAGVLDRLRDEYPERWDSLNEELGRLIPEFDKILFDTLDTPRPGMRVFKLRLRGSSIAIGASDLSQGTVLALAILTIAYLSDPPPILGLEEPDRGLHPRLLRDVRDAMYRLAYPDQYGDKRQPVQVIATTHSPYMLDLFRDHPEEVVIAEKVEGNVQFHRLSDRTDLDEILQGLHLGDAWYSGILGGVPANR
jgi:predicted ATPase